METQILFSTHTEYEEWLKLNHDKALEYIKENDVVFRNIQMSARAYNALRMNRMNRMSDIIFMSSEEIFQLDMMDRAAADEILMFKRNFLRKHKKAIVDYVSIDKKLVPIEVESNPHPCLVGAENKIDINQDAKIIAQLRDSSVRESLVNYFKYENKIPVQEFQLSNRTENLLLNRGINFAYKLIRLYPIEIERFEGMGTKSADETRLAVEQFVIKQWEQFKSSTPVKINKEPIACDKSNIALIKELLTVNEYKEKLKEYLTKKNILLEELKPSVRTYNALRRGAVCTLADTVDYYPDGFSSFRNMGQKSIDEIKVLIEKYVADNISEIVAFVNGEGLIVEEPCVIETKEETDPFKLTIPQLLVHPAFKDKTKKYLLENNITVEQMGLSVRSVNAFMRSNILSFYDALSVYPDNLSSLRNIGAKSIDEIKTRMEYYISKMQNAVSAYCSGDVSAMYSDGFIYDTVMSCFEDIGFKGVSFKQIREAFPDEFEEIRIKKCIGRLLADKQLEYVDFRLYRVYPSVYTVIEESTLDSQEKDILLKKLNGMTLEAIAQEFGVTRERIRQKFEKNYKKLRVQLQTRYGFSIFDEDYYAYLYTNYEVIKELWLQYLGVAEKTFGYLVNSQAKGKKSIEDSLGDPKIDLLLKFKIKDYLNRNKVLIDGNLIERQRADIEDYALSKFCQDEMSYDIFVEQYNQLLKNNDIEYDDKLYYTDDVRRTRGNRLADSKYCLWKQGEKIRYYDISGQDYEELLQTLNLGKYIDIELSTLKFMEDFPDVMEKYDIRDQYELHNLLKKIVNVNDYHDMVFHRQPMIQFGEFDRAKALYSVLEAVAPVTTEELADYIHMEFGYDKATTMWTYLQSLNQFYHQGVYSIDFKRIPNDRVSLFKERLTEEFYYISEVKEIYKEMFGDVDLEEINPFSLKSMGFAVFTTYVIQNFQTAESYFTHLLTSQDVYDISTLNGKFMNLKTYYCVYIALRQNYDIFLFDKNQAITMNRLSKLGITKEDIKKFCDDVVEFAEEGTCFTMHSLREAGFVSELDDLGFDDYFYAGILAMDPRFMWQHVFGVIVLSIKTGRNEEIISKKSFLIYALSKYDSVDLDDFISDCLEEYGINISDRYEITRAVAGTDMYYDSIMAKVYRNKNCYYAEFDD